MLEDMLYDIYKESYQDVIDLVEKVKQDTTHIGLRLI
jgi:hypothetical protein